MLSDGIKKDLDDIFGTGIILEDEEFDKFLLYQRYYTEMVKTINDAIGNKAVISEKIHRLWMEIYKKYGLDIQKSYNVNLHSKEITECNHNFDGQITGGGNI